MARTNNLTNFLTDVAGAIKEKKGSQTAIQAANFDTEILALPSQGTYQEKTVTITQNGQTTLTPDTGYDAMDQVEITVNVPIKQLQSKTVSVTSNGNVSLLPDSGYDGFNEVNLQVNVPTGGSGDVKLFETEQAMQADPNPQEGDLAIVYRNEITVPSPGDTISSITPPATVVFDTAISGSKRLNMRGNNCYLQCTLRASQFVISDMYRTIYPDIRYTSSDGLTYTRTDTGAASYDLGEEIEIPSTANTNILQFFQTGGVVFEGLYEYVSRSDDYFTFGNFTNISGQSYPDYVAQVAEPREKIMDILTPYLEENDYTLSYLTLVRKSTTEFVAYCSTTNGAPKVLLDSSFIWLNDKTYIAPNGYVGESGSYRIDINTGTQSCLISSITATNSVTVGGVDRNYFEEITDYTFGMWFHPQRSFLVAYDNGGSGTTTSRPVSDLSVFKYRIAPTQLTLENASQLLPDVLGYGKNGLVTGDGTIYDSTPPLIHLNALYGESLGEYAGSNGTLYFPQNTNTQTPVSAPEETAKIHWLKSKSLVENNDKLVLAPQAEYEEFGTTTSDGRYTIKYAPDTAPANSYSIIDHQTQEEWIWTPGSEGRNTPHVSGHKAYFIRWSPVDGSYARFLLEVYSYDFDTRTSTQLVHYTFSDTYTTDPTLMSTNAYICPDLDFWYIITNRSVSSKYSLYLIGGRLSQANDVHIIYRNFEHSGYVDGSSTFSSDGHLWLSVSEDYGSSVTLLEYSLETFALLNTYGSNACGFFSYNTNYFYHPVAYTDGTYLYALTSRGRCKINFRNGTYETYDQPMPVFCDYQNGNYFSYGSLTDAYNTVLQVYGNKNLQITKQYQISRMTRSKMNATSTPFFIPLGEQDGKVLLTDYSRPVQGIPYTNGTILDHDMSLMPIGCNTSTLLFLYALTKKSENSEPNLSVSTVHLEGWVDPSTDEETDVWYLGGLEDIDYNVYLTTLHAYNRNGVDITDSVKWEVQIVNSGTISNISTNVNFGMDSHNNISFLPAANVQSILIDDWFIFKVKCTDVYGGITYSNELQIENSAEPETEPI